MIKIKITCVWAVILILMIIVGSTSQVFALDRKKTINQYGHNTWLKQNGLPARTINVVLQTKDGYLWLGTSAGLFRFDGVYFTEINTNPKNDKTHESISTLVESRDSSLWIGTTYNGLRNLKNGKISSYGIEEGSYDGQVRQLFESRTGCLIIGTSIGVFMFQDGKFTQVLLQPNYITAVAGDSLGRIWVGTHDGIRIFKEAHPTKIMSLTLKDGLPNRITTCIYFDRQANIWIGTVGGLVRWKNGKIKIYTTSDGLLHDNINTIYQDRDGNIWVGTQKGLNRLSGGEWTSYTKSDGLTNNYITSFEEDFEGSLWVSTSDGLNQFKDVNITPYTTTEGLANNYISSALETSDGSLYFLSDQGSSITRIKNGKSTRFDVLIGPAHVARDGSIWIGQNGLLFHLKNNSVERYDTRNGLPAKWISAITEDNKSLIIYSDHTGIFRFIQGRLEPYTLKSGQQYPPSEYVVCFYPQRDNLMWIGTPDWLSKIEDGKITRYTTADGLAGNWVSSIFDDRQGSLWISSLQGGLTRYRDGKFTIYNTKIGLFTDEIYCVLVDDQGDLWLSSSIGIGHISRQDIDNYNAGRSNTIHTEVYGTDDGMKTDECFGQWQPAGWKAHDGRLWFATKMGAVMIDPKAFSKNTYTPPVLIEKIVIDQQTSQPNQFDHLSPGKERFEFHYTALSFLVPERVLFKFKLEGYDRDWVDAGTSRIAYYTKLQPGEYTFQVVASNNDGIWNNKGTSLRIIVLPPFWRTNWAYGCYLLFAVFLLYLFRRIILHEAEINRTVELEKHEIQKLEEMDALKMRFFSNISHEFRSPLTLIIGPIEKILRTTKDEVLKLQVNLIYRNAHRLLRLINQLMDFRKLEEDKLELNLTKKDVVHFIKEIIDVFKQDAKQREIDFNYTYSQSSFEIWFDTDKLDKIIYNLLSNAFKYTPDNGHITVSLDFHEGDRMTSRQNPKIHAAMRTFKIVVKDSGIGIPKDVQARIFDRFYQVKNTLTTQGTGIGLSLTYELVSLHKGYIGVESEPNQGSEFTVVLPLWTDENELPNLSVNYRKKKVNYEEDRKESFNEENITVTTLSEDQLKVSSKIQQILVIEDNADMRLFIKNEFEGNYNVIEAHNGALGLDKAFATIPDAIICDVMMPGMDGHEVCRTLKHDERTSHIPIIMLTARSSEQHTIEGLESGADDYIAKPFSSAILGIRIKNLIESRILLRKKFIKEPFAPIKEISPSKIDEKLFDKAYAIVEKNLDNPNFDVNDFAREIGMSRTQLYRKINAISGQSVKEFIRIIRLKKAAELLLAKDKNITEIAYTVGFNSLPYFTTSFTKYFGMNPSRYIKKHIK